VPETPAEQAIQDQYQEVNKELLALLEGLGVQRVEALGKDFDARDHEAVQMHESTEYADQVVCKQFHRGYRVGERLVRPALVVVSSGPGSAGEAAENAQGIMDGSADSATAGEEAGRELGSAGTDAAAPGAAAAEAEGGGGKGA
jgi:molecular chaperone GrpE